MKNKARVKMRKYTALTLAGLMAVSSFAMGGCSKEETGESRTGSASKELLEPVGVIPDTDTVTRRDVIVIENQNGAVIRRVQDLSFDVDGHFVKYYVSQGDHVMPGDVIAEISQDEVEKQIESLEKQIAELEENYVFSNKMTDYDLAINQLEYNQMCEMGADSVSQQLKVNDIGKAQTAQRQELERQQAEMDFLNQQLEKALAKRGETQIVAPAEGEIVGLRDLVYGGNVTEGTAIVSFGLINNEEGQEELLISTPYVNSRYVNESKDYYALINGKRVEISYEPYTAEELKELRLADVSFNANFIVDGDAIDDVSCGDYAKLCFVTKQSLDTLSVYNDAIYKDNVGYYVYRVTSSGGKERVNVEVGIKNAVYTEIISGLEEGDQVYVQN